MLLKFSTLGLSAALLAVPVHAKDKLKIGFISTLSGPNAEVGQDMLDAFNLALKQLGGRIGGLPTEIVVGDDQAKPDTGRRAADKMVDSDRVDIVTGIVYSNVIQALAKPVLDSGTFLISSHASTPQLAGSECHPNFFVLSAQADTTGESVGAYARKAGFKRVYMLGPNYVGGKSTAEGFKRFYKGEPIADVYTPFGQLDYAAEIAQLRAAKPDAVFAPYPQSMGVAFLKQYVQSGLMKEVPFLSVLGTYEPFSNIESVGEGAAGAMGTVYYHPNLRNPANQKFVADFRSSFKHTPGTFAAMGYDTVMLLDSAVRAVGGKIEDKKAFSAALKDAKFASVRGSSFKFGNNHFPIQDFYLTKVGKGADGKMETQLGEVAISQLVDSYASQCTMK